jgi:hypothetical protein
MKKQINPFSVSLCQGEKGDKYDQEYERQE